MYCKNCGHPIQDTDRFCGYCGSPNSQEAESADQAVGEEVIYNAPSSAVQEEGTSHYPKEISLVFEEKEEAPVSQHSAIPEEEFQEEEQSKHNSDFSEFSWNVQDFPKPRKVDQVPIRWGTDFASTQAKDYVEDEPFVWNMGDMAGSHMEGKREETSCELREAVPESHSQSSTQAAGVAHHEISQEEADRIRRLEEEIFAEAASPQNGRIGGLDQTNSNVDDMECFFTFSKKNEEFQKLLDREYDKVQKRTNEDQPQEKRTVSDKIQVPQQEERGEQRYAESPQSYQAQPTAPQSEPESPYLRQAQPTAPQSEPGSPYLRQAQPTASQSEPESPYLRQAQPTASQSEPGSPYLRQAQPTAPQSESESPYLRQAQPTAPQSEPGSPYLRQAQPIAPQPEWPELRSHHLHQMQPIISQSEPEASSVTQSQSQSQSEMARHTKPISRDEVKEAVKKYMINLGEGAETPSLLQISPSEPECGAVRPEGVVQPERAVRPESAPKPESSFQRRWKTIQSAFLPGQSEAAHSIQNPVRSGQHTAGHMAADQMSDPILPDEILAAQSDKRSHQDLKPDIHRDFHELQDTANQDTPPVKRPVGYVNPQADEMVYARAGFFGATASLDYVQMEQAESRKHEAPPVQEAAEEKAQAAGTLNSTASPGNFHYEGPSFSKKKKRLRIVKWAVLAVVILVLVVEGTALGVKYFAPQSVAAIMIQRAEQSVMGLFQKKDGEPIPDSDQTMDQEGYTEKENLPTASMDELILQQIGNNYNNNIVKVEANPNLVYDAQKDYGVEDVNNSLPIADNFWLESDGVRYNYDATVVGTVIAYCSKWMSFVNQGDESVFSMLASGGAADQQAKEYKPEKDAQQTINSLQLGEIRQGFNGFYIWTQENISIVKGKKTEEKQQNYIYYMAPNGRSFQVIDYYPY